MGGTPGIVSFLHTWNQQMLLHPHVHMLVSSRGLDDNGRIVEAKHRRLAPHQLISAHWRATFINMLRAALRAGDVVIPPSTTAAATRTLLVELKQTYWHVHTFAGTKAKHSLRYNVAYSIGGCIGNTRVENYDGDNVTIRCRHRREEHKRLGRSGSVKLSRDTFITRLLSHVPAHHQRMIGHYGLYASSATNKRLLAARRLLGQAAVVRITATVEALRHRFNFASPHTCPVCRAQMAFEERARGPPSP
jgi:hypothetical protein